MATAAIARRLGVGWCPVWLWARPCWADFALALAANLALGAASAEGAATEPGFVRVPLEVKVLTVDRLAMCSFTTSPAGRAAYQSAGCLSWLRVIRTVLCWYSRLPFIPQRGSRLVQPTRSLVCKAYPGLQRQPQASTAAC